MTNNNGTIQFYLNESGGTVTVTYGDGTTNANFDPATGTGLNEPSGAYSFSMAGETSYSISVFKVGSGTPTVTTTLAPAITLRGIDVNKNIGSPYFGRVYETAGGAGILSLNPDLSYVYTGTARAGGVTTFGSSGTSTGQSPDYDRVAPDDFVIVSDASENGAAIYRIDPTITTNQLLLGPVGYNTSPTVHGTIESPAIVTGSIAGGNLMLYDVDGELSPYNSIQAYNIGSGPLPWETAPSYTGGTVGVGVDSIGLGGNEYCGLSLATNGNIFASTYRNNLSNPLIQVYDSTGSNVIWNSWEPAGTAYPGGSPSGDYFLYDSQGVVASEVSPDDQYVVAVNILNRLIVCPLTNGIPNVAGLVTVPNPAGTGANCRGVCWDAADNVYISSSGLGLVQEWSLGLTADAVTSGNLSGVTGFQVVYPSESVNVTTTNDIISQANTYGNATNSSFTITRTGTLSTPLTVDFTYSGSALGNASYPASYTAGSSGSVVLAAGQASTNINIAALQDSISRPTTALTITLGGSAAYTVMAPSSASITILNTGPQELFTATGAPTMYNAFSNDYVSFSITRWGDTNAAAYTVNGSSFTIKGGTAVEGTDYTQPTSVTINPGDLIDYSYINPLINGHPPVHAINKAYTGTKTIIAALTSGSGFTAAANTNNFSILDYANPPATVLFADPLTNSADATNWAVTAADNNMQSATTPDTTVNFGYDLLNGDPFGPIPYPPNGSEYALRITVNKNSAAGSGADTGVNLYPTNVAFSGNYAVRFNMNLVEGSGSYTTEGSMFGINHSGICTNWWSGDGLVSGWGPSDNTTWESDGVWYWISVDGGAAIGSYVEFTGAANTLPNTGWKELAGLSSAPFDSAFKTNVFTSDGGPGLAANGGPDNSAGLADGNWADVEIKQYANVVALSIDKTLITVYTNTTSFTNGTIMLGYEDPFASVGAMDASVYFSNLQVVRLTPPAITATSLNAGTFVFDFTSPDATASFQVVGAIAVNGPYTAVTGASITPLGNGAYQASVPARTATHFYRVQVVL
ncbi:MAG TPA: hypothetical protein VGV18_00295 [Verrucomicrobiae bacterium]|nr:hypothetical protein [Verrucomicrobiae bacterium]